VIVGRLRSRHQAERRRSDHPYWIQLRANAGQFGVAAPEEMGQFWKDIRLINALATPLPLEMRCYGEHQSGQCHHITKGSQIRPGKTIITSAPSGLCKRGQIGLILARIYEGGGWCSEWQVEPCVGDTWTCNTGIGVKGDSGAGIIYEEDNTICAMLWGRNHSESPLVAYVTDINDIEKAIREDDASLGPMRLVGCNCRRSLTSLDAIATARTRDKEGVNRFRVRPVRFPVNVADIDLRAASSGMQSLYGLGTSS